MTLNADISQRNCHVRFTPDNDRESEFPQTVTPKSGHVRCRKPDPRVDPTRPAAMSVPTLL
jgi:hypothetical protein